MTATHSPRASLADVARLAGVSSQTVSRVVRDIGVVAPATRARVLKAVNELGYVPNIAARSLSQRRTNVIHIVNATPLFHGHARTFLALVSVLTERGYHTSIAEAPQGVEAPSLDQLVPIGVDGLILLGGHDRSLSLVESVAGRLPVVFVGQIDGLPEAVASVGIDQFGGAAMATTHLLDCGYRNLLHICGPGDWLDARIRRDGFISICEQGQVPFQKVSAGSWDASAGYAAIQGATGDFDAIFASNDQLALGAIRWLAEQGRRVPDEVGVIGFDNADGTDNFQPPLTTLRQPHVQVGRTAVAHLRQLIDGGPAEHTTIQPQLITRRSTRGLS